MSVSRNFGLAVRPFPLCESGFNFNKKKKEEEEAMEAIVIIMLVLVAGIWVAVKAAKFAIKLTGLVAIIAVVAFYGPTALSEAEQFASSTQKSACKSVGKLGKALGACE